MRPEINSARETKCSRPLSYARGRRDSNPGLSFDRGSIPHLRTGARSSPPEITDDTRSFIGRSIRMPSHREVRSLQLYVPEISTDLALRFPKK